MRCPSCADTSVHSAVYIGATALVPPVDRSRRSATTFQPVSGIGVARTVRESAPERSSVGRSRADPQLGLVRGDREDRADTAPGRPGATRQLVPDRLGPDAAACREQRRATACPCVRARRREFRVLVAVHLVVGRAGVAGGGAERHAVEGACGERGVEPAHALRRPVVLGRAPADRDRRRMTDRVARGGRRRVDEPTLACWARCS